MDRFYVTSNNNIESILSSKNRHTVLFIGGFGGWWNLGDFLQLKSVISFYKNTIPIVLLFCDSISSQDDLNRLKRAFPEAEFLFYSWNAKNIYKDLLKLNTDINIDVIHLYGGGFLNEYWGRGMMEITEKALNRFKPKKYVITGQQISQTAIENFKRHIDVYKPDIVGVRDFDSLHHLKQVKIDARFSWDDSADKIFEIKNSLNIKEKDTKDRFGVHVNISDYVVGNFEVIKENIDKIFDYLKDKKPVFFQVYNRNSVVVKDTIKSIEYLSLSEKHGQFNIVDLMSDIAFFDGKNLNSVVDGLCCFFSNSYHAALFFSILGIPSYLFSLNEYYTQKHRAVMGKDVKLDDFVDNILEYANVQQDAISKNLGERAIFLKEFENIVFGKDYKYMEHHGNYTYDSWSVNEERTYREPDIYIKNLIYDIDSFKQQNEYLIRERETLKEDIENKKKEIEKIKEDIENKKKEIEKIKEECERMIEMEKLQNRILNKHNYIIIRENERLKEELWLIWNSNAWKFVNRYYKMKEKKYFSLLLKPLRFLVLKIFGKGK